MKKHNEQFEKNIARLVKSTGEQQIPSESFTNNLIDEALKELGQDQPKRQTRSTTMNSMAKKLTVIAASILIIAVAIVSLKTPSKHSKDNNKQISIADTETMAPLPLELPKPMFVGTPQHIPTENLEPDTQKPRPPFYAPVGAKNLALNKPVTSSEMDPICGTLDMIVDGDKEATDGSVVELGPFAQWIVIDLQKEYELYAILVWHYHKTARVYKDVAIQVSEDPEFIENVTTLFNNDIDNSLGQGVGTDKNYIDKAEGKLVDAKGTRARYVKLWSQGNNQNDYSDYIEVEVWGKPAE